jgi:SAM-dependent methyltransferase
VRDYDASTYGENIAEVYDEWYTGPDTGAAVECLAMLARQGPVLELAIGTGRVALPLAARGLEVHGIDASSAMVAKLRAKPGGDRIPVTIGDFADVGVTGEYALILVVFNTFFALLTQEDQIRCFRNVAAHLAKDGSFVVEAFVPDLGRFDRNQRLAIEGIGHDQVRIEASQHDPASQCVQSRHIVLGEKGLKFYPLKIRYAWPSELDLMARLAGLRLRNRWGGWHCEPFNASSTSHVSVYGRCEQATVGQPVAAALCGFAATSGHGIF